eukprot:GEMP01009174.1.p1 GENE.GEMP01009174.1~~GEMP01009174.1.p1  ORF type:complete len:666 (+),score=112.84 GEMP01009174.1:287-2284(+)
MGDGHKKGAGGGYAKYKEGAKGRGQGGRVQANGNLGDVLDAFATERLGRQRKARTDKDARMLSETQALLSEHQQDNEDDAATGRISEATKKQMNQEKRIRAKEAKKFHALLCDDRRPRKFPELVRIAESLTFEGCTTLVALLQVIFISLYMDCLSRNTLCADSPETKYCECTSDYQKALNMIFILSLPFFLSEWILRLYVGQMHVLTNSVFLVDTLCTWICGIAFLYVSLNGGVETNPQAWLLSLSVLRVIHVTSAIHFVARKPLMKEVWLLIRGFSSSLRTLFCSAFLMVFTIYIFAVIGTATIGHSNRDGFVHPHAFLRAEAFDSLFTSCLTLFRCLFNDDAFELIEELHLDFPHVSIYYYVYVATMSFVVMNLIIGVIVDNALEITSRDEEMIVHEVLMDRRKLMEQLAEIFGELDSDGSGVVTFEEFINAFQIKEMRYMLQSLDFDEKDLIDLFQTLDDDNTGCLNLEEFLFGMSRLQGEPRAKDFLALMKLSEACADLALHLAKKKEFVDEKKELSVESAHTRDVLSRVATMRDNLTKTTTILKSMIKACKTVKTPAVRKITHKSDEKNNTNKSGKLVLSLHMAVAPKEDAGSRGGQSKSSRTTAKSNETTGRKSVQHKKNSKAKTTNPEKGKKETNLLDAGSVLDLEGLLNKANKKKSK